MSNPSAATVLLHIHLFEHFDIGSLPQSLWSYPIPRNTGVDRAIVSLLGSLIGVYFTKSNWLSFDVRRASKERWKVSLTTHYMIPLQTARWSLRSTLSNDF